MTDSNSRSINLLKDENGNIDTRRISTSKLLLSIDRQFNLDDLKSLAFTLDIDFDNLRGETKEGKIRELILLFSGREKLNILINKIDMLRPKFLWNNVLTNIPIEQPKKEAKTDPVPPEPNSSYLKKMPTPVRYFFVIVIIAMLGIWGVTFFQSSLFERKIDGTATAVTDLTPTQIVMGISEINTATSSPEPTDAPTETPTPQPTSTPTSSPTDTPTTTPEPTFTATPTPAVKVALSSINVRSGPGTRYDVIGVLSSGEIVIVIGSNDDNNLWYKIRSEERLFKQSSEGWVADDVVEQINPESVTAVPTIPAPPTPSPPPNTSTPTNVPVLNPTSTPQSNSGGGNEGGSSPPTKEPSPP
ncbi:MAG: SH3 domain-containing protein [Chloroflexi bacterium]|nr:SH3 domain-containing protein [Chloroflexota bacterium]